MTTNRRMLGVHEQCPPALTGTTYPGAAWTREFVAGRDGAPLANTTTADQLIAMVLAKVSPSVDAGGDCVVSLKLDMTVLGKGGWDAKLTALGLALAGMRVVVILWHEPEDDLTAQVFVKGFNRGRKALKRGWGGLTVAYCSMAYQWLPTSQTTADAAAWRKVEADLYLIDAYSGRAFPATAILPGHEGFRRWHAELVAAVPGRAWGVAERGWQTGPDRASTIAREADWLADDPVGRTCSLYCVWSTGGTEADPGWLLDDTAKAAVADLIRRMSIPAGYAETTVPGFLLHTTTGALIAAAMTDAWDTFTGAHV